MSSTLENRGAYLTAPKAKPLEVRPAPFPSPKHNEVIVRNHAVAINPTDWMKQEMGTFLYRWIKYPFIEGCDLAGEVISVGTSVTRVKAGDRVLGFATSIDKRRNDSRDGAFQLYTVVLSHLVTPIPDNVSYEEAAVLPLCIATAADGLFRKDHLALQHPTVPSRPTGKTVIVWGGSTSVGCCAVQLAVAAGYEVISTCSPKNFELVRSLGAKEVFDYSSTTIVRDVVEALKGKPCAGAYTVGKGAAEYCLDILDQLQGKDNNKFISMATYPMPETFQGAASTAAHFVSKSVVNGAKAWRRGIKTKMIFSSDMIDDGVGPVLFEEFLPKALAQGTFRCMPPHRVVGEGLEAIQEAFEVQKKGVSAEKIVVRL
jgi:NADPH:quinone reductase-like Zn-dependent oxidoreductase